MRMANLLSLYSCFSLVQTEADSCKFIRIISQIHFVIII